MSEPNQSIPLSLYIHLPWCIKKCPYCDFNSHEIKNKVPEEQYINALVTDLKRFIKDVQDRKIISIFIGGGTPSIFSAQSIQQLLNKINELVPFSENIEITIEANPGTMDQENFTGFREAGVNRISIGAQSFANQQLQKLGRIHDAQDTINSVQTAKQAGFENINIDLMYALPQQTLQAAMEDLEKTISLSPSHISYYQLTLEPNTHFYRRPPSLPDSQTSWAIQQAGMKFLSENNYFQYEVSAYAKDNKVCVHNKNYWQFGDYLGIGAGAHQKISFSLPSTIVRCEKPKHPQQYMHTMEDESKIISTNTLNEQDIVFEFLLNALRLKKGFTEQLFKLHTGLTLQSVYQKLQSQVEEGLLIIDNNGIRCSEHGYRFLDDILQNWLPEARDYAA